jgi:hypothetical protein
MPFPGRTHGNPEILRRERVRQLFVARYSVDRTGNDVLNFFLCLQSHNPDLLLHEKHDERYQRLKGDLSGLYLCD